MTGGEAGRPGPRSPSGPATRRYRGEEDFRYFVGWTDEMIKNSGYRVNPAGIEEAAYARRAHLARDWRAERRPVATYANSRA